jgi:hypothetical protein
VADKRVAANEQRVRRAYVSLCSPLFPAFSALLLCGGGQRAAKQGRRRERRLTEKKKRHGQTEQGSNRGGTTVSSIVLWILHAGWFEISVPLAFAALCSVDVPFALQTSSNRRLLQVQTSKQSKHGAAMLGGTFRCALQWRVEWWALTTERWRVGRAARLWRRRREERGQRQQICTSGRANEVGLSFSVCAPRCACPPVRASLHPPVLAVHFCPRSGRVPTTGAVVLQRVDNEWRELDDGHPAQQAHTLLCAFCVVLSLAFASCLSPPSLLGKKSPSVLPGLCDGRAGCSGRMDEQRCENELSVAASVARLSAALSPVPSAPLRTFHSFPVPQHRRTAAGKGEGQRRADQRTD